MSAEKADRPGEHECDHGAWAAKCGWCWQRYAEQLEALQSATSDTDVPLCGGCAQAWFTERNLLPGDQRCVVCAFLGNPDCDAKNAADSRGNHG